jgi:hypothetical protein
LPADAEGASGFGRFVGERSSRFSEKITPGRVEQFRSAIRAEADGIPPTFLTRYRHGEFELFKRMGVELSSILHLEQGYELEEALRLDDELGYETALVDWSEKRGLHFLVLDTFFEARREGGRRLSIGKGRTRLVVRKGSP